LTSSPFCQAIEEINDPRQFYLVLEYVEGSIPIVTSIISESPSEPPTFVKSGGDDLYSEREASHLYRSDNSLPLMTINKLIGNFSLVCPIFIPMVLSIEESNRKIFFSPQLGS
jgi:hypothetical protein